MIVVPARNEAPRVGRVVAELRAVLPGVPILVVENGSSDATAAVASDAGAEVLTSEPGYARALRAGFAAALLRNPPWIAQLDADEQHPAAALPGLLAALAEADLVVGSRFMGDAGYPVPLPRRAANHALAAWASVCAGRRLRDVTSGLRAWRPSALATLLADWPEEMADANLLVRAVRRGLRVRELPVRMRARTGGRSMHAGLDGVRFAATMVVLTGREALSPRG